MLAFLFLFMPRYSHQDVRVPDRPPAPPAVEVAAAAFAPPPDDAPDAAAAATVAAAPVLLAEDVVPPAGISMATIRLFSASRNAARVLFLLTADLAVRIVSTDTWLMLAKLGRGVIPPSWARRCARLFPPKTLLKYGIHILNQKPGTREALNRKSEKRRK